MNKRSRVQELRQRLQIDKDNLDVEVIDQVMLYDEVSEKLELAISRRDEIKFEIERATAELDKQFRSSRDEKRQTNQEVARKIEATPRVRKRREEFLEAQERVRTWSVLKGSYDQRNSALKILGNLYSSNYFTRTSVKGMRDAISDREADDVRERISRKRKRQREKDDE